MWWYHALHARVLDLLPGTLSGPVLDAGCGTGGFLARLRRTRPEVAAFGLEYNPAAAARARTKSGAPVACGSVTAMPFGEARFAAVISLDVLCHAAAEPPQALAEMRRVLAPDGQLILNLPAFAWLRSAHDVRVHNTRRFTLGGARAALLEAGFRPLRLGYWNALLLPLMAVQRKLLARAPDHRSDVATFPPWLDRSLHAATALERRLGALGLRFPAGGSVLALAARS